MMSMEDMCYPRVDEDLQLRIEEQRADAARRRLDPSDVLAETQHLLLSITDDEAHPLWRLIEQCTTVGTEKETGVLPPVDEFVGAALMPIIDQAISALVRERLLQEDDR